MTTQRTLPVWHIMVAGMILIGSACTTGGNDLGAPSEEHAPGARSPTAVVDLADESASIVENDVSGHLEDVGSEDRTHPSDARLTSLTQMLADSSVDAGLILWGTQTVFGAVEAERYDRLEDLSQRASTVVVGTIIGPGPSRVLRGDPGTDDVVTYESTEVEVVDVLAGTRDVNPGDHLIVESFRAPDDKGTGTVAVLFLRHKQDTGSGELDADALADEAGLYRLISHQGVFIDRGDGVPVNPISEVMRLIESGEEVPLDEFVLGTNVPSADTQPIAAQARALTMDQLLQLIIVSGKPGQGADS